MLHTTTQFFWKLPPGSIPYQVQLPSFRISKMPYPPLYPWNNSIIIVNPLPLRFSTFFVNLFRITDMVRNFDPIWLILCQNSSNSICTSIQLVTEGVIMTLGNSGMTILTNFFSQIQPTLKPSSDAELFKSRT